MSDSAATPHDAEWLEDALHDAAQKFTLIEEELASLRRDALRWADETYDESMAQRIRMRLLP